MNALFQGDFKMLEKKYYIKVIAMRSDIGYGGIMMFKRPTTKCSGHQGEKVENKYIYKYIYNNELTSKCSLKTHFRIKSGHCLRNR